MTKKLMLKPIWRLENFIPSPLLKVQIAALENETTLNVINVCSAAHQNLLTHNRENTSKDVIFVPGEIQFIRGSRVFIKRLSMKQFFAQAEYIRHFKYTINKQIMEIEFGGIPQAFV